MNSPAKLTDTQFVILSEASQRKDRCLIPPKTLKAAAAMTAGDRPRETVSPARQRGAGVAPGGNDFGGGVARAMSLPSAGVRGTAEIWARPEQAPSCRI